MHFFRDLCAKVKASRGSVRDARHSGDVKMKRRKKSAQRCIELVKHVLADGVKKIIIKKSPYKIDIKSMAPPVSKRLLRILFFKSAPGTGEVYHAKDSSFNRSSDDFFSSQP